VSHQDNFRRCLIEGDVAGARRLWAHVAPHLPQPKTYAEAEAVLHMTRTTTQSIEFKLRAYSHAWLIERNYPSRLPDDLKPKAERMYPRTVEAVGISVNAGSSALAPAVVGIRGAMENAVLDAFAEGKTDPGFVNGRMMEARQRAKKYFADLIQEADAARVRILRGRWRALHGEHGQGGTRC
jgi:hypothetical protein